jgi:hypothetical protein
VTYVIIEGVRRAKAAELLGWTDIACVLRGDSTGRTFDASLADLRSRRLTVEVDTVKKHARFQDLFQAMQAGRQIPPLVVARGKVGIPIANVQFDLTGDT